MKGSLHTDELMHEVVAKDTGLRTARRMSHVFALDVPAYPAPPVPHRRRHQHRTRPRRQARHRPERHRPGPGPGDRDPQGRHPVGRRDGDPKLRSTIEAAALCKMADRKQITGGVVDGPLAFDNAVSEEAARAKGIVSAGGRPGRHPGRARPRGRQHARQAAGVPGRGPGGGHRARRRVPIALTSRADKPMGRMASCAIALLLARKTKGIPDMTHVIPVLNAGSSSVKFSVFAVAGDGLRPLFHGAVRRDRDRAPLLRPGRGRRDDGRGTTSSRDESRPRKTPCIVFSAG